MADVRFNPSTLTRDGMSKLSDKKYDKIVLSTRAYSKNVAEFIEMLEMGMVAGSKAIDKADVDAYKSLLAELDVAYAPYRKALVAAEEARQKLGKKLLPLLIDERDKRQQQQSGLKRGFFVARPTSPSSSPASAKEDSAETKTSSGGGLSLLDILMALRDSNQSIEGETTTCKNPDCPIHNKKKKESAEPQENANDTKEDKDDRDAV